MREHKHIQIPKPYPERLEDCLDILTKIEYKSYGFPHIFLSYESSMSAEWDVCFRNPVIIKNDFGGDKNPVIACHKCFDALNTYSII